MHLTTSLTGRAPKAAALALLLAFFASPSTHARRQQQPPQRSVVGVWQAHVAGMPILLRLDADGTGEFDGEAFKYTVRGSTIVVVDEDGTTTYNFTFRGDALVVSGGDLPGALTFTSVSEVLSPRKDGRAPTPSAREGDAAGAREKNPLVGRWQTEDATVVIADDGTLTFNGESFDYSVKDNVITLSGAAGSMSFPFELSGDTLSVRVNNETVVYRRAGGAGGQEAGVAEGVPEELVGKWCYMANVNTGSGGRMSNRCFTLNADGTYEYYAETSSSGPVASSASQESDAGRWRATQTSITSRSQKTGTNTYRLERRNHPKTGDPMLVLDGDAYVTVTRRAPWPN